MPGLCLDDPGAITVRFHVVSGGGRGVRGFARVIVGVNLDQHPFDTNIHWFRIIVEFFQHTVCVHLIIIRYSSSQTSRVAIHGPNYVDICN